MKKEEMRNNLPNEPDSDNADKIDILLKLPNGTRLERRFLSTDSLEVSLYYRNNFWGFGKEIFKIYFFHSASC